MASADKPADQWRPAGRSEFLLDPGLVFLNHGSFGACPRPIFEAQTQLRARMERNPVRFLARELPELLDVARREVALFVGARPENLAFVRNASSGVSAVLRSLQLRHGDELLLTDHAYNACRNAAEYVAERAGARLRVAAIPFPLRDVGQVLEAVLGAVGPRTRLALIDHVTSPTGLVLPIAQIIAELARRGVDVLVDGAHAPGMLDLDLEALGAAYYTGNLHKWCCAPKGAALIWVRPDKQCGIHPVVISHGFNSSPAHCRFIAEFDWTGSDDPTPWLCAPEAIRYLGRLLPGGWPELRQHCRGLALAGQAMVAEALAQERAAPEAMIGFMAAQPLPDRMDKSPAAARDPLQAALYRRRIEIPVIPWPARPKRLIRLSAMIYNQADDYRRLAAALHAQFTGLSEASD